MDWRVYVLFLLVKICYGDNTCKTNPNDDKCYCVLDKSNSTDNWYEAVSLCQDQRGILVDIESQDTYDFVVSLMREASVTSAWVGIKGDSPSATLISDPSSAISYPPTWNTPLAGDKMCASITSSGDWEAVECSGSGIQKYTICRMPQIDSSGYNIETGCPFNGFLHGSKCYQIFTWTTGKMFSEVLNAEPNKRIDFCNATHPGGKLILPTSDDEFQFILKVGKLSRHDNFWIRVEYGPSIPNWWEYPLGQALTISYGIDELKAMQPPSGDRIKFVINIADGSWGQKFVFFPSGLMCEFNVGTPGAAKPSVCPALNVASTTISTTDVTTVVVTTAAEATTPEPTTARSIAVSTTAPTIQRSTVEVTTNIAADSTTVPTTAVSVSVETRADESTTAPEDPASKGDVSTTADSTTAPKDTTALFVATSAPTSSEEGPSPQGLTTNPFCSRNSYNFSFSYFTNSDFALGCPWFVD